MKKKTEGKTKPMSDIEIRDVTKPKPGKTLEVTFTIPITIRMTVSEAKPFMDFDYIKWVNETRPKIGVKIIKALEEKDRICTDNYWETFRDEVQKEFYNGTINVDSVVYK